MPFSGATMNENELSWRIQLLPPQVSFRHAAFDSTPATAKPPFMYPFHDLSA
jgi:hypothetical protein